MFGETLRKGLVDGGRRNKNVYFEVRLTRRWTGNLIGNELLLQLPVQYVEIKTKKIHSQRTGTSRSTLGSSRKLCLNSIDRAITTEDSGSRVKTNRNSDKMRSILQKQAIPECRELIADIRGLMAEGLKPGEGGVLRGRDKLWIVTSATTRARFLEELDKAMNDVNSQPTHYEKERILSHSRYISLAPVSDLSGYT